MSIMVSAVYLAALGIVAWATYSWGYRDGFEAGSNKVLQQAGILMAGYLRDPHAGEDHSGEAGA